MKKVMLVISLTVGVMCLWSCGGSSSKAIRGAEKLIEKGKTISKETSELEKTGAYKHYKSKQYEEKIENFFDDDQPAYNYSPNYVTCSRCNGQGFLYATDSYGNIIFDYFGNYQVVGCPVCGGTGVVLSN